MYTSPARSQGSPGQSQASCDRLLANLFRDLSTQESLIELRRQDLSRHPDFCPMKLFQLIDIDRRNTITVSELLDFMNKHYLGARYDDAENIIKEYDGNQSKSLDFDEFSQLVLPSANPNLRHIASTRRFSPYFRASSPLPYEAVSLCTRLLDKEMQLHRQRLESQRQLARCPDFIKVRVFDQIARGFHAISMPDLIFYLEKNGFYPRREDIEAILRRMDHDANRQISYDEFCELTCVQEKPARNYEAEQQQQPPQQTPQARAGDQEESKNTSNVQEFNAGEAETDELRQTNDADKREPDSCAPGQKDHNCARSPEDMKKKKKSSSAQKQKNQDMTAEEKQKQKEEEQEAAANERAEIERQIEEEKARIQQEKEEREQREAEEQERRDQEEKERQVENFMFLRLLKLILKNQRQIEIAKEVLFSHKTFDVETCFRLFDDKNEGEINAEKFEEVFQAHNIEVLNLGSIVPIADQDDDNTIDYKELSDAILPRHPEYRNHRADPGYGMSVEQKKVFQQAWMESLAALFGLIISSAQEIEEKRTQLQLDGERLFDCMDNYKMGYLSTNAFAHWVSQNCGYSIPDYDLPALASVLDKNNDYRITKDEFIAAVSAPQDEEEEEGEAEAEAEAEEEGKE